MHPTRHSKTLYKLGRVFNIPLYIHISILYIYFVAGVSTYGVCRADGQSMSFAAVAAIGMPTLVYLIVLAHELGHALAARRFGIRTRRILLMGLGGVATLVGLPEDSWKKYTIVAVAGPMVNVVLAIVAFPLVVLGSDSIHDSYRFMLGSLFTMNVIMFIFNLIPAYPMDGGRILHGLMWAFTKDFYTGLKRACKVGIATGVLMIIYGVWSVSPMMVMIALLAVIPQCVIEGRAAERRMSVPDMARERRLLKAQEELEEAMSQLSPEGELHVRKKTYDIKFVACYVAQQVIVERRGSV